MITKTKHITKMEGVDYHSIHPLNPTFGGLWGKIVTIAFLCFGYIAHAQHTLLTVKGVELTITSKTMVSVKGNLVVKSCSSVVNGQTRSKDGEILNNNNLFVTDSIFNFCMDLFGKTSNPYLKNDDGTATQLTSAGSVIFNGTTTQPISNNKPNTILFHNMDILNPKGVKLNDTVTVLGKVSPLKGSLFLNGKNLELFYNKTQFYKYDGYLGTETNNYKVWDTTKISNYNLLNQRSGHIVAKYLNNASFNAKAVTFGIKINTSGIMKIDTIQRGTLKLPYAGNGSIRKYFVIKALDKFNNYNFSITYLDSSDFEKLHIKEPDFRMFFNQGNSAVTFNQVNSTLDTVTHLVKGDISVANAGSYVITIADSACSDPPRIKLNANAQVCQGLPFQVTANIVERTSSQMLFFTWYKNGTLLNDTLDYLADTIKTAPAAVKYRVKIFDNRGCFSYDTLTVNGRPLPIAGFKADSKVGYCMGSLTTLTDTSKIADNTLLTRKWSLDDGTLATSQVITHTYSDTGTYNIKLISTSKYGCADSAYKKITIHPLPQANFSYKNFCGDSSLFVRFTNLTNSSQIPVYRSKWIFGANDTLDLKASMGVDPVKPVLHQFSSTGTKTVDLIIYSSTGCTSKYTGTVNVSHQTIDFTAANVCLGNKTVFNNRSLADAGTPSYSWDFGDNTTSSETNPQKTYAVYGPYDVTLYMETGNCTDSLTKTLWVNPRPSANFTSSSVCVGVSTDFNPTSKDNVKIFDWNIDGSHIQTMIPSHVFNTAGIFPVTLTVTSDSGCVASATSNIEIYARPHANFSFLNVCQGDAVHFYNQSTLTGGSLTYRWTFDDGDRSTEINPEYTFAAPAGNKSTELIAVSNHNCADTIVKVVETYPLPAADMATPVSTCGSSFILDATVNNPAITVTSYVWDNGSRLPTRKVSNDGNYSVDITSSKGCKVSESVSVALNSQVDPRLPNDTSFCGEGVLDAHSPAANCTWFTGEHQRYLTVTNDGWYGVTVIDQNDCYARDSVYVTVHAIPQVSLGSDIAECSGTQVSLDAGPEFSIYKWSTGANTQSISINSQDRYKVTVTDAFGCKNSSSVNVTYLPVPGKPLPAEITGCKYAVIDARSSVTSYLWNTGETSDIIRVENSGEYWVRVSNGNTCYTYDTVKVNILAIDDVHLGNDISVCEGTKVTLDAGQHSIGYTYKWNKQTSASPLYNVNIGGRYTIELLNTTNGCSSKDTINVQFMAGPRINLGNDKSLCNALSATLDAGNPGSVIQWGSSNGMVSTQQTIDVTEAGKYWVTVVNEKGCYAFDTIQIYPSSAIIIGEFIFDSDVYTGDTVNFCNMSSPLPYTSDWQFGDGVKSTVENPSHVFYFSDVFNVTLTVSNDYCSSTVIKPITVQPATKKHKIGENYGKYIEITSSKVYPNPNGGEFTFEITLSDYADIVVAIFDLKGAMVNIQKFKNVAELTKHYSLTSLGTGVYILKAMVGNKNSAAYKIIKY
jgi:PKD repeat protein